MLYFPRASYPLLCRRCQGGVCACPTAKSRYASTYLLVAAPVVVKLLVQNVVNLGIACRTSDEGRADGEHGFLTCPALLPAPQRHEMR